MKNRIVLPRVEIKCEHDNKDVQVTEAALALQRDLRSQKKLPILPRPVNIKYSESHDDGTIYSRCEQYYLNLIKKLEEENQRLEKELGVSREENLELARKIKQFRTANQQQKTEINQLKSVRNSPEHLRRAELWPKQVTPLRKMHTRNASHLSGRHTPSFL